MKPLLNILTAAALAGILPPSLLSAEPEPASLTSLENRLKEIDSELKTLAHLSLRSGVGAIGFRSKIYKDPDHTESVQVELNGEIPIDKIVLVPTVWRHVEEGFIGDAFPSEFRVIAGSEGNTNGTVIASYAAADSNYPGIAPHIIACTNQTASWVRIEATKLASRYHDGRYLFQLSEIMIFSDSKNEALHRPVTTSSPAHPRSISWNPRHLTDGFTPYLMNGAHGDKSLPFITSPKDIHPPVLSIDLGETYTLTRIHLHAVDQSDTVPQSTAGDLAIPRSMTVEGANRPDFSDAVELLQFQGLTIYATGPIMMWNLTETPCRYVRFIIHEPFQHHDHPYADKRVGFAEIELFSNDRNVAAGKPFDINLTVNREERLFTALTDQRNLYGNILPIRTWMEQLARRRDLEIERPFVMADLTHRYARQKAMLRRMSWIISILTAGTVIIILIDKMARNRAILRTRKRIAANLHDELGANLHAIGLLGDHAIDQVEAVTPREELSELVETLNEMRSFTELAGAATRYCVNMLECPGLYENLPEEMQRIASRLLVDIHHSASFVDTSMLGTLKKRACIDLYLFYKECLTNILRHASATEVSTTFQILENMLQLTVIDNGCGLDAALNPAIPKALKRRARLLRAHLSFESTPEGGTTIRLTCPLRKIRAIRKRNPHA
ncbi:hypothetical protein P4E94_15165 [Pontiellaceae bacterium B12219]|nr:hypothetical protein [Pontiellaceae bacterium B12219]